MKAPSRYQKMVIFDLDGTLIDSAPSILECFAAALREANLQPVLPLDSTLIGPPLRQTLMNLTGLPAGETIEQLVEGFKNAYDSVGYQASRVYPGVEELLAALASNSTPMAIATNKRLTPTLKIVEHFGWHRYFRVVGALDNPASPSPDKTALIKSILADCQVAAPNASYIGDKHEDGVAAAANGVPFCAACWGYGAWDAAALAPGWALAASPAQLTEMLTGGSLP